MKINPKTMSDLNHIENTFDRCRKKETMSHLNHIKTLFTGAEKEQNNIDFVWWGKRIQYIFKKKQILSGHFKKEVLSENTFIS